MKPLGGRGKKAPYETTQMRVPIPLKPKLEGLIADYREKVLLGDDDQEPDESDPPDDDDSDPSDEETIQAQARMIQEFRTEVEYLKFKLSNPSQIASKLVDRFIEEKGQADKLETRNNVNLVRFRDWLQSSPNRNPDL